MIPVKTNPEYKPIQLTDKQIDDYYQKQKVERLKAFSRGDVESTVPVHITVCNIAGIIRDCFMTGVTHTNANGTRHEIITYNLIRGKVQKLWLSDYCFRVVENEQT